MKAHYTVAWFSAGVSSAVATRLAVQEIDELIYIHIDDQHPDTLRFVDECERWIGKPIKRIQSEMKTVEESILKKGGGWIKAQKAGGAFCTIHLKKALRHKWEKENVDKYPFRYVWGMDVTEKARADRLRDAMPEFSHKFPLIERGIGKQEAHEILKASGIKRPAMYDLGYLNNNCIGCIKGGMGYWNKIRKDFPEVFAARAKLERELGATILKDRYLEELEPDAGRNQPPICDECGIMCQLQKIEQAEAEGV